MSLYDDYKVTFRGKPATVRASVRRGKISLASICIDGDLDSGGKPVLRTFDEGGDKATAFDALPEAELRDLFEQVVRASQ